VQRKTPLALGNVMGSTIANILGAFSLGLLFHPGSVQYDRSAMIYTALLFVITTVFVALTYFGYMNRTGGVVLIVAFAVYLVSIAYAIYRGVAAPLENLDSDGDSDGDGDNYGVTDTDVQDSFASETSRLLNDGPGEHHQIYGKRESASRSLLFHICQLAIGVVALSLSGYVLSHSASTIASTLNLSGTVVGITILSFATTLPEKLVAIMSGSRGHSDIMIASAAGSNIFLLTLCMGIIAVTGMPHDREDNFVLFELGVTWLSSALLLLIAVLSPGRWSGVILIVLYVAFLVLEFTVYKR
jgi:Ca2+/Na+ antiporter